MTVVERQINAYNEKDIDKFLSFYSKDIKAYMLEAGKLLTEGIEQLEDVMKNSFEKQPRSKTEILDQIEQGNLIVNKERITDHTDGEEVIHTLSIYEIEDDKIVKVWFGGRTVE